MKIIFLEGKKNCGKTATIRMLFDMLTKNSKNKPVEQKIQGTAKKDFQVTVKYKKIIILLFSAGDTLILILIAIIIFINIKADYLIIPFSQGGTRKAKILNMVNNWKQYKIIHKTVCKKGASEKDKNAANKKDCQKIMKAII